MGTAIPMLDLMFFLTENQANPRHVGAVLVFERPKRGGAAALRRLREAYRKARPVPPFNRVPVFAQAGLPEWREVDEFDMDWHLQEKVLPSPGTDRQLFDLISELHAPILERDRPGWRIFFIDGLERDRFAIYAKVHHSLMDGQSGMALLKGTLAPSPDDRKIRVIVETRLHAPARRAKREEPAPAIDEARSLATKAMSVGQGATRLLEEAITGLRGYSPDEVRPYTAQRNLLNAPIQSERSIARAMLTIDRMKSVARAWDATLNDVALCVVDAAMNRYLAELGEPADRPLVAVCPVSLHDENVKAATTRVSAFWAPLGQPGASIGQRMRQVTTNTAAGKQRIRSLPKEAAYAYSVMTFALSEAVALVGSHAPVPFLAANVLVSNVRGPEAPLYLNGARLESLNPVSTLLAGMGLNVTLMSYAGQVGIVFTANAAALPDIGRMAAFAEEAFEALVRAKPPARRPVKAPAPRAKRAAAGAAPSGKKLRSRKRPPPPGARRSSRAAAKPPAR
jgi:WS/DGAT/MGAT family acyltransferase